MIEKSHGRARPTLPRSSDLPKIRTAGERGGKRDAGGRFAPGNDIGRGRGWRNLIKKSLGTEASTPLVEQLVRETLVLHGAFMRELPFHGAQVTALTAARARWTAISAHMANRALELGLESDKGRELLELSMRLDQRAERLSVTALDLAARLAETERKKPQPWPWLLQSEPDKAPARPAAASATSPTTSSACDNLKTPQSAD